jgi:hypothetical protein
MVRRSGARALGLLAALLLVGIGWSGRADADEPIFGFTYTTDLLPKGQSEVEQWLTLRTRRPWGDYSVLEGRSEYSFGVTDAFQLSGYLKYAWADAFRNSVDRKTQPPETFAEKSFDEDRRFESAKFIGLSIEGIWRLLSPYTGPFGLAILVEPTIWDGFVEFESRLILQKNFFDDRLVLGFNVALIQELRELPGDKDAGPGTVEASRHWDRETDLNWSVGASYRFARNWSAALEFVNEREFSELIFWQGKYATNSAYYAGPTLHYGGKNMFFTLTLLDQLPIGQDFANPPPGVVRGGRNYADDFERYRVRIKLGYYF